VIITCGSAARIHATARSTSSLDMTAQEQIIIAASAFRAGGRPWLETT